MCGIAGIVGSDITTERLVAMTGCMVHRGPDDAGTWISADRMVGLAHRRLSILDLSPLGRNPMEYADGALRITYNGEIYNFLELREELERVGYAFRSRTDTEVVLAAYQHWGEHCVTRLNGMFGFAIWDKRRRQLLIARDRMGEKPVYYAHHGSGFAFASELKGLAADPRFSRAVDADAVGFYLRYGYIPPPYSIFKAARKLPAGHYGVFREGSFSVQRYWDPATVALRTRQRWSEQEALARLTELFKKSVRQRMIADVPFGAFLSGGIDSSAVVALMQEQSPRPVKTFTIRFEDAKFNEADFAAEVAQRLGTEHHEETCNERQMLDIVETLPFHYDEPFYDSSAIPTTLLSRVARKQVTVSLSGDGGDELFYGYPRYQWYAERTWLLEAPRSVQQVVGGILALAPIRRVRAIGRNLRSPAERDRLTYWMMLCEPAMLGRLTGSEVRVYEPYFELRRRLADLPLREHAPIVDLEMYLPEDILTKVDRATMSASLESRAPFLDHELVEFALSLPLALKFRGGQTKWILRRMLAERLPAALFNRPKQGFSVPLTRWFRGPLRARVGETFASGCLESVGIRPPLVEELWKECLAGDSSRADFIWSLYMLGAWARRWKD